MKKMILLLLTIGLIAGVAVACGGPGITNVTGAGGIAHLAGSFDEGEDPEGDFRSDDDEGEFNRTDDDPHRGEGSDITFDINNIVLPGEGVECDINSSLPYFTMVRGNVVSIETGYVTYVTIKDAEGFTTVLVVGENTLFPFSGTFEVGNNITGWYQTFAPAPSIYPPQYIAAVLAAGIPEGINVRVDRFKSWGDDDNDYFISNDGSFAFRIDENTEVILEDGVEFIGNEFDGRRIVVMYPHGISTRIIPEMKVASKLIVLYESIIPMFF